MVKALQLIDYQKVVRVFNMELPLSNGLNHIKI